MPLPLPKKGNPSGPAQLKPDASLSSRLPRSTRGYDCAATDKLLGELASKQAELERECVELREQAAALEAKLARHRSQEQLVSRTLVAATSHAMSTREEARREAELILRKARAELQKRAALTESVERERAEAERELLRLRELAQEMQTRLATFLTQTLEQLGPEAGTTGVAGSPQTGGVQEALVSALEAALKQEDDQLRPSGGDVAPFPTEP